MSSPYQVTRQLEEMLCAYTGAKYAVAVNSATAAILLSVEFFNINRGYRWLTRNSGSLFEDEGRGSFIIPKRTYKSVPDAIIRAGGYVIFDDIEWRGEYEIGPSTGIWDSARRFTSGMYRAGQFQCVSFATSKILGIEQGGAILHDNDAADPWFRKMRFDGRTEGVDPREDTFDVVGHHCIMLPSIAAQLVLKLHHLPRHNEDMPDYPYPDLSLHPAFK